ncbi:MAG: hypothetical protein RMJ84_06570 [Sandaracinaceae bacterium]|nr:hypothetical protein [Sandaracinaceae bacterium]
MKVIAHRSTKNAITTTMVRGESMLIGIERMVETGTDILGNRQPTKASRALMAPSP